MMISEALHQGDAINSILRCSFPGNSSTVVAAAKRAGLLRAGELIIHRPLAFAPARNDGAFFAILLLTLRFPPKFL
jgi:hypothetical protein